VTANRAKTVEKSTA